MLKRPLLILLAAVFLAGVAACGGGDVEKKLPDNPGSNATTDGGNADGGEPLTCSNGALDSDESDVDCGGSCTPCVLGDSCDQNTDCASNFCNESGVCETEPLATGEECMSGEECQSGTCKEFGQTSNCTEPCTDTCPGQNLACFRGECTPITFCDDPDGDGVGVGPGCDDSPCDLCSADATCAEQPDSSFACVCNDGFVGDGQSCSDVDECADGLANCANNATCTNTPGSFICACDAGFEGDGTACTDIDECATNADNCDPNATCTNLAGSFACACPSGFQGDGTTCSDIDECSDGSAGCDPNATCTNSPGSFACDCDPGYDGDGFSCAERDECQDPGAQCGSNAECVDQVNDYTCICESGYAGDPDVACNNIDECTNGTAQCDTNATCVDTPGSFMCECDTGFTGDGMTCSDADECALGTDNCSQNATCTNTFGSFTCACDPGFDGDGVTCTGSGDTCGSPFVINTLPYSASGDTTLFTVTDNYSYGDNACPGDNTGNGLGQPDQVYAFTPPTTGDYIIDLSNSNFDVRGYVVSDCSNVNGTCQGADYNFPFTVTLTGGTDYSIIVDGGFSGDEGQYTLDVYEDACANSNPCDPVATCENDFNGPICTCPPGYTGDGFTCQTPSNTVGVGAVVITEIMQNPAVQTDADGEWFELYNASAIPLDLDGCRVLSQTSTGDAEFTISGSPIFAPGDRMVFATSALFAGNADYVYNGAINLNNDSDTLQLRCMTSAGFEEQIDLVAWDDGATFPDPNGASMNLQPSSTTVLANDSGSNWCEASSTYNGTDRGTPGSVNDTCP